MTDPVNYRGEIKRSPSSLAASISWAKDKDQHSTAPCHKFCCLF